MTRHVNINGCFGGMALGFQESPLPVQVAMFYETNKPCKFLLEKRFGVPVHSKIADLVRDIYDEKEQGRGVSVVSGRFRKSGDWEIIRQAVLAARPATIVVESMAILRSRGLVILLKDIRALGYAVEGHVIPANACGASYSGERLWIVAHSHADGRAEIGQPDAGQGDVGKQFVTDDLLDEFGVWLEGGGQTSGRTSCNKPRILRRTDRLSRRVDAARVRFLSSDVSPRVASFIGWCVMKGLKEGPILIPLDKLVKPGRVVNVTRKTKLIMNVRALDEAKIRYKKKNNGLHLVIKLKKGRVLDYWPSSDVYMLRGTATRGSGVKNVISMHGTL